MSDNTYKLDDGLVELEMSAMPSLLKSSLRGILADQESGLSAFAFLVKSLSEGSPERRWAMIEAINVLGRNLVTNVSQPQQSEAENLRKSVNDLTNSSIDANAGIQDGLALMLSHQPIGEPLPEAWFWYASDACPVERYAGLVITIMTTSTSVIMGLAKSRGVSALSFWDSINQ